MLRVAGVMVSAQQGSVLQQGGQARRHSCLQKSDAPANSPLPNCITPITHYIITGVHDDEDPEYSILKQRMVNKMKEEGTVVDESFNLCDITKIAERTITAVSSSSNPRGFPPWEHLHPERFRAPQLWEADRVWCVLCAVPCTRARRDGAARCRLNERVRVCWHTHLFVFSCRSPPFTYLTPKKTKQDMEKLISKTVDTSKADYAVITGVQIHNWARTLDQPGSYSMEFVAPSSCYAVVNGVATHLDLSQIPQVGFIRVVRVQGAGF